MLPEITYIQVPLQNACISVSDFRTKAVPKTHTGRRGPAHRHLGTKEKVRKNRDPCLVRSRSSTPTGTYTEFSLYSARPVRLTVLQQAGYRPTAEPLPPLTRLHIRMRDPNEEEDKFLGQSLLLSVRALCFHLSRSGLAGCTVVSVS